MGGGVWQFRRFRYAQHARAMHTAPISLVERSMVAGMWPCGLCVVSFCRRLSQETEHSTKWKMHAMVLLHIQRNDGMQMQCDGYDDNMEKGKKRGRIE